MPFYTRDGREWQPQYLISINPELCIGCGRCYKVCGHNVLGLYGVDEDGQLIDPEEDDDGDIIKTVMTVQDEGACIGCSACARVCPTKSQIHAAA
ncbi:ferredoxin III, nif-specific [Zymomonas sp.]|uniref:ferredoxin III, nif-specific n=1 Tax=Zymomonas sp. TaxID=2068624 RepID=UPI0025E983F0|nr:ferredoxin III, nif-specific [Zymomonas sp.]MCA1955781.1 ferredoxin III, nif-specific [Zymomonas sp.]